MDKGGDDSGLNKGPWSQAEDSLLIAYVNQHGCGNWNAVQKHSGLSRCGKSCRLRWVNHLRPDLKKGAFSEEEEQLIIRLHAKFGNKWAIIAEKLPGRTDNEIKNYWNTRVKKSQRFKFSIYPDGVKEQAQNAEAQSDVHQSEDSSEANPTDMPVPQFRLLRLNPRYSYYQSLLKALLDDPVMEQPSWLVQPNLIPSPCMEQESSVPFNGGHNMNEQSPPVLNYPLVESISEQFMDSQLLGNATTYTSPAEPLILESENISEQFMDSHLLGNATTYTSPAEPLINEAENLELPSSESFTLEELDSWIAQQSDPMQVIESDNTLVPQISQTPSDCPPLLHDGSLESIVYGSYGMRHAMDVDSEPQYSQFGYNTEPQYSQLGYNTEAIPANANTTSEHLGYVSPTSADKRLVDDWIKEFLA